MSSAQERAAEVIARAVSATGASTPKLISIGPKCARALAAAGLLVDDDTARLVERGRQAEAIEARAREELDKLTEADYRAAEDALRRERRWMALGKAVEMFREMDVTCADGVVPSAVRRRMRDIYREAGVSTPPETHDRPLSGHRIDAEGQNAPNPPDSSSGHTEADSGGAG